MTTADIGPVLVEVPPVVGMPEAAASVAITDAGLTVGRRSNENSSMPIGDVIRQNPGSREQMSLQAMQ